MFADRARGPRRRRTSPHRSRRRATRRSRPCTASRPRAARPPTTPTSRRSRTRRSTWCPRAGSPSGRASTPPSASSAKDAGATIIIPVTSNLTPPQIAASCNRQNYKPAFVLGSASDEQAAVAGLDGSISVQGTFPWFLRKGSPAIVEYANALKKYAPDLLTKGTSDVSAAWTAAKVFQQAAETGIAAKATPSPALVLDGLYAMKDYDVDGLMPELHGTHLRRGPADARRRADRSWRRSRTASGSLLTERSRCATPRRRSAKRCGAGREPGPTSSPSGRAR